MNPPQHAHAHAHSRMEQLHDFHRVAARRLVASLVLTVAVLLLEFIGGLLTGSVALVSDAGHMLTHAVAIAIGLVAIRMARTPPCHHRTFGLHRAEVVAAFANGLFLLFVTVLLVVEAVERFVQPAPVLGREMLWIAIVGLVTNVASMALIGKSHQHDMNVRGVFFHLLADAASSVGVVGAAIAIDQTGWTWLDPLVSLGISALIVTWAWGVLRDAGRILLETAPAGLTVEAVNAALKAEFGEIRDVAQARFWALTPERRQFSAHIVAATAEPATLGRAINRFLEARFAVGESTIQVHRAGDVEPAALCAGVEAAADATEPGHGEHSPAG